MLKNLLAALFLLVLLAESASANPPRAVLLAQTGTNPVSFSYSNIYAVTKSNDLNAQRNGWVEFDGNSYTPTRVHFTTIIIAKRHERAQVLEPPVLLLMPGDTITVLYDAAHNNFRFWGRHQAELDFCVSLWRGNIGLDGFATEQQEVVDEDSTVTYFRTQRPAAQPVPGHLAAIAARR